MQLPGPLQHRQCAPIVNISQLHRTVVQSEKNVDKISYILYATSEYQFPLVTLPNEWESGRYDLMENSWVEMQSGNGKAGLGCIFKRCTRSPEQNAGFMTLFLVPLFV